MPSITCWNIVSFLSISVFCLCVTWRFSSFTFCWQWTANGKKGSAKKRKVTPKKMTRRSSTVASSDSEKASGSEPEEGTHLDASYELLSQWYLCSSQAEDLFLGALWVVAQFVVWWTPLTQELCAFHTLRLKVKHCSFPSVWNSLLGEIRRVQSTTAFKTTICLKHTTASELYPWQLFLKLFLKLCVWLLYACVGVPCACDVGHVVLHLVVWIAYCYCYFVLVVSEPNMGASIFRLGGKVTTLGICSAWYLESWLSQLSF